jgi:hypothetical protein
MGVEFVYFLICANLGYPGLAILFRADTLYLVLRILRESISTDLRSDLFRLCGVPYVGSETTPRCSAELVSSFKGRPGIPAKSPRG